MGREVDFFSGTDRANGEKLPDHITIADGFRPGAAPVHIDPEILWAKGSDILRNKLDKQIYAAWIKPLSIAGIELSNSPAEVTLCAPNKFCCEHVKRHYGQVISSALNRVIGAKETAVVFRVSSAVSENLAGQPLRTEKADSSSAIASSILNRAAQAKSAISRAARPDIDHTNLNPRYNFSNFVVGACNQFAHAACLKAAENPGSAYNPLFIYGGVGLGKTHLANAIGNACRRRNLKVLLTSSETFVSELISSLKTNNMDRFKSKFRSLDVLIIDDIQFIIGKERTQEEFFHTFNELYNRRKQIVITADKVPQELTGLEERLRTRFASGLSADIQPPDFETRVAILAKKSETDHVSLPTDVVRLIAERIDTNVRELEGALVKLKALCSVYDAKPSVTLVEEMLRSIAPARKIEASVEVIQKAVANRYSVSVGDLLGKRRTHNIAFARQVAMYLSRKLAGRSYPEIGALFGGRDHSTVIHACKVIVDRIAGSNDFNTELRELERSLMV